MKVHEVKIGQCFWHQDCQNDGCNIPICRLDDNIFWDFRNFKQIQLDLESEIISVIGQVGCIHSLVNRAFYRPF